MGNSTNRALKAKAEKARRQAVELAHVEGTKACFLPNPAMSKNDMRALCEVAVANLAPHKYRVINQVGTAGARRPHGAGYDRGAQWASYARRVAAPQQQACVVYDTREYSTLIRGR